MKAVERNASTPEGAQSLMGALSNKHDGSILDNLGGLFGDGVDNEVSNDGAKILGHVLGNRQQDVEKIIGEKSGLDSGSVANILKVAAPIIMGVLGKQAKQANVQSKSDLGGLLGNLLGGASNSGSVTKEQTFLEKVLDSDGDGSVIDDVADMVLSGNSKKGGLGDLLGGLFGK